MRQHVAVPSRPVLTACLCACLPFATPAAARPAHCFNVLSRDRALEQRGATLVPVGTPRRYQSGQCRPTVLFRVSCSCYFLSVRKPSTCLPTCSFVSLSLCHRSPSPIRPQLSAAKCSACCPACDQSRNYAIVCLMVRDHTPLAGTRRRLSLEQSESLVVRLVPWMVWPRRCWPSAGVSSAGQIV